MEIKVSEVLEQLNQGKVRKEIAEHFGLTMADCNRLFKSHPMLKNAKPRKKAAFTLVDDTLSDDVTGQLTSQVVETVQETEEIAQEEATNGSQNWFNPQQ